MTLDWTVIATITAPIIALFVGVWVNRKFENRPILKSYFGHISAFRTTPPGQQQLHVNTHTVVLRNTGRRSATNVRIHHSVLPDFNIWPSVAHSTENLPDGSRDIVIPALVPGEEIIISYLYFPPLTVANVNAGIKCDAGFAQQVPVLLQRQFPLWVKRCLGVVILIGTITIGYLLYAGVSALVNHVSLFGQCAASGV